MKKADLILLGAAFAAALIFYMIINIGKSTGDTVYVTVDGKYYAEYPLDQDTDIIIPGAKGMNNHLVIKNGTADIVSADCPDRLCVKQKAISLDGETLVCLPNKVVVEIRSESGRKIDAVAQ